MKRYLMVFTILTSALVAGWYFMQPTPAPQVTFTTIQGKKFSMADLRGKMVLVNFWATSCSTCIKEMPKMVETYRRYQAQGLELIAVAMSYDPPSYVVHYAQTRQLPFAVVLDVDGGLAKSFADVQLTPTTFLIDQQGNIIKRYVGEPDFGAMQSLLQQLKRDS